MVELGVPTCRMGLPPDPARDCPYPGVSPSAFDPSGALAAYRQACQKEKASRIHGQAIIPKIVAGRGVRQPAHNRLGDIMPGHGNLRTFYEHLGYTFDATSGLPIPPHPEPEPVKKTRLPQLRKSESAPSVASASSPSKGKGVVKLEGHSRLMLLDAWYDQMKADNNKKNAPNLRALWPAADGASGSKAPTALDGDECYTDVGTSISAMRSVISESTLTADIAWAMERKQKEARLLSLLSRSSPPPVVPLRGKAMPEGHPAKPTWTWDHARRAPALLPPGVKIPTPSQIGR